MKNEASYLTGLGALLLCILPATAQNTNSNTTQAATQPATQATTQATNAAGQAVGSVNNTIGTTGNAVAGQLPGTVSAVGNTANGLVGGLQPTLQPVTQGVGGALNNLTQPDNISALLQFLSSVVPNHIEAHVNLDALQVEKLTIDVRGVDLRNLKVDLLVANSRNAGQVRPALQQNNTSGTTNSSAANSNNGGQPLTFTLPQNQNTQQSAQQNTQQNAQR